MDLLVEGAFNGMLAVRLEPPILPGAKPIEIPLELLLRDQHNSSLDEKGNRTAAARLDDVLRVQIKQTHLYLPWRHVSIRRAAAPLAELPAPGSARSG